MKIRIKLLKAWGNHQAGAELEMDQADAQSLIDSKWAEKIESKVGGGADDFEKQLDEYLSKFKKGMEATVTDSLAKLSKAVGKKSLVVAGMHNDDVDGLYGYNPDAPLGDFAKDVKLACGKGAPAPERLLAVYEREPDAKGKSIAGSSATVKAPTGQNETGGDDGGFLVPTQMGVGIRERVFNVENLISRTDSYNVSGNSIEWNGLVDDSRVAGVRHGGVRGYWLDEGDQLTGSKVKFHKIRVTVSKLAVLCYVTDELLGDSTIALDQYLTRKAGDEISFLTSDALYNGDGIGKPLGVLNGPSTLAINRTTASHIKATDIMTMWNRMWAPARANAIWMVNQEAEPDLDQMSFLIKNVAGSENVGGWPAYFPAGYLQDKPWGILKGRPVIVSEFCAALGTKGDLALVDWSNYLTCVKGGIKASISIHLRFDWDEVAFKFTYRVGGQPWWNKALTPYKGTNTYSPYIVLN